MFLEPYFSFGYGLDYGDILGNGFGAGGDGLTYGHNNYDPYIF